MPTFRSETENHLQGELLAGWNPYKTEGRAWGFRSYKQWVGAPTCSGIREEVWNELEPPWWKEHTAYLTRPCTLPSVLRKNSSQQFTCPEDDVMTCPVTRPKCQHQVLYIVYILRRGLSLKSTTVILIMTTEETFSRINLSELFYVNVAMSGWFGTYAWSLYY